MYANIFSCIFKWPKLSLVCQNMYQYIFKTNAKLQIQWQDLHNGWCQIKNILEYSMQFFFGQNSMYTIRLQIHLPSLYSTCMLFLTSHLLTPHDGRESNTESIRPQTQTVELARITALRIIVCRYLTLQS